MISFQTNITYNLHSGCNQTFHIVIPIQNDITYNASKRASTRPLLWFHFKMILLTAVNADTLDVTTLWFPYKTILLISAWRRVPSFLSCDFLTKRYYLQPYALKSVVWDGCDSFSKWYYLHLAKFGTNKVLVVIPFQNDITYNPRLCRDYAERVVISFQNDITYSKTLRTKGYFLVVISLQTYITYNSVLFRPQLLLVVISLQNNIT